MTNERVKSVFLNASCHVVPCHYAVTRPRVAAGGYGLQIWREARGIPNKLPRTADKRWSSSLGFGLGANILTART
jgi:hypothetical protein